MTLSEVNRRFGCSQGGGPSAPHQRRLEIIDMTQCPFSSTNGSVSANICAPPGTLAQFSALLKEDWGLEEPLTWLKVNGQCKAQVVLEITPQSGFAKTLAPCRGNRSRQTWTNNAPMPSDCPAPIPLFAVGTDLHCGRHQKSQDCPVAVPAVGRVRVWHLSNRIGQVP